MVEVAQSIDLKLSKKLKDRNYRKKFFLAEASARIAKQLIALRNKRNLSQTDLANELGTRQPAISRVESADYQNWSFTTLRRIADVLDARIRVTIEPAEDVLGEYEESNTNAVDPADLLDIYKAVIENMGTYITGPTFSYNPPPNLAPALFSQEIDQSNFAIVGKLPVLNPNHVGALWTNSVGTVPFYYPRPTVADNSDNKFGARSRLFKFLLKLIDKLTGRIAILEAENARLKSEIEQASDVGFAVSNLVAVNVSVAQKSHWGRP